MIVYLSNQRVTRRLPTPPSFPPYRGLKALSALAEPWVHLDKMPRVWGWAMYLQAVLDTLCVQHLEAGLPEAVDDQRGAANPLPGTARWQTHAETTDWAASVKFLLHPSLTAHASWPYTLLFAAVLNRHTPPPSPGLNQRGTPMPSPLGEIAKMRHSRILDSPTARASPLAKMWSRYAQCRGKGGGARRQTGSRLKIERRHLWVCVAI